MKRLENDATKLAIQNSSPIADDTKESSSVTKLSLVVHESKKDMQKNLVENVLFGKKILN